MANKKIPMRQCVGCAEMKSKNELIRVIKTPENEIVLDSTGKKNGRGAYVCPAKECITRAVKEKRLEYALKSHIGEEVLQRLLEELEND